MLHAVMSLVSSIGFRIPLIFGEQAAVFLTASFHHYLNFMMLQNLLQKSPWIFDD